MKKKPFGQTDLSGAHRLGFPPGFDALAPSGDYTEAINRAGENPPVQLDGWRLQTAKIGIGVLAALVGVYSAGVIFIGLQGLLPALCTSKLFCRQLNLPTETFGLLIVVGVNCVMAGSLWWASLTFAEFISRRTSRRALKRFRTLAWWACGSFFACGVASLVQPLLVMAVLFMFYMIPLAIVVAVVGGLIVLAQVVFKRG